MALLDSRGENRTISSSDDSARYVAPERARIETRADNQAPSNDYSPRYVAPSRTKIDTRALYPTIDGTITQASNSSTDSINGYPFFGQSFNDLLTGGRLSGDRAIAVIPDTSQSASISPIVIIVLLLLAGTVYYFYQKNKG